MKASNAGAAAENAAREHSERFAAGLKQFNSRLFFDAHETWEEIWLASAEPDKTFLQGIIQIAAAFHHYGRGNMRGTCWAYSSNSGNFSRRNVSSSRITGR